MQTKICVGNRAITHATRMLHNIPEIVIGKKRSIA